MAVGMAQKTKQTSAKRTETPNEKFARKGGKTIQTEILKGDDEELTASIITDQRDLKLYDQAGHFNCRRWTTAAINKKGNYDEVDQRLAKARDFVWEHWQNKKRGYLRITFDSVDAVSTSHIFIEPDSQGAWQIVWRIARWHAIMRDSLDDMPVLRQVEKSKNKNGQAILIFKDADGEDWNSL
jgi:hypothetical protein